MQTETSTRQPHSLIASDRGDRSREVEIHNYYRVPPYWGAY